jgi:hypothetical protein
MGMEDLGSCGSFGVVFDPLGAQRARFGTPAITPKGV